MMVESPLSGEVNPDQESTIDTSEYDTTVGAGICTGTTLTYAPTVFCELYGPHPRILRALTLARIRVP